MRSTNMFKRTAAASVVAAAAMSLPASGAVVDAYLDFESWSAAAGDVSTIGFADLPGFTLVTDQYQAEFGVVFPETELTVESEVGYPNDGFGLNGLGSIWIEFDELMTAIATDHPGTTAYRLWAGEDLVHETSFFGGSGQGFFEGLVSDTPFDRVEIFDIFDGSVAIDDLHFAPVIPGPGAMPLLVLAGLAGRRRARGG